jgi:hypothetical protein
MLGAAETFGFSETVGFACKESSHCNKKQQHRTVVAVKIRLSTLLK